MTLFWECVIQRVFVCIELDLVIEVDKVFKAEALHLLIVLVNESIISKPQRTLNFIKNEVKAREQELDVVTWAKWIDNEMSIPLARKISKDFFDDSLADLFEVDLIVGVAEIIVSRLNAKFSVSLFDQFVFFFR